MYREDNSTKFSYIWDSRDSSLGAKDFEMPEKIHRFEIDFETGIQRDIDNNHCRTMRVVWVDPSSVIPRWTGQIPKPPQDFAIAYGHPHCPMPTRPCPQPTVETPVHPKLLTFGLENCDSELVDR